MNGTKYTREIYQSAMVRLNSPFYLPDTKSRALLIPYTKVAHSPIHYLSTAIQAFNTGSSKGDVIGMLKRKQPH